jgi:hypothetical protein
LKLTVQVGDAAAVPLYPTIDAMPPTPESPSTRAPKAKIPFRRTGPTVHRPLVVLVESPEDPKLCRGEAKRSECNVHYSLRPVTVTVRHCPLTFVHHTTAARESRLVQCNTLESGVVAPVPGESSPIKRSKGRTVNAPLHSEVPPNAGWS